MLGRNIAEGARVAAEGLVAEGEGVKEHAERRETSEGRVRGYVARSSCGANWDGLT